MYHHYTNTLVVSNSNTYCLDKEKNFKKIIQTSLFQDTLLVGREDNWPNM